jgi:MFS family permease
MEENYPSRRLSRIFALNRTVVIVLLTVLFFGLGEQLWSPFVPAYFDAQAKEHATAAAQTKQVAWNVLWIVGIYAFVRNVFEGFCYIGGGQLTARLGDRGSLILFGVLTVGGYLLFLVSSTSAAAVIAAVLIMGWEPLSVPVTFTTVGATVSKENRGMAFALQSIQKRLPRIIGPVLAGWVIERAIEAIGDWDEGMVQGTRLLVAISLVLALATLAIQFMWMPHRKPEPAGPSSWSILREMPPTLRSLLLAEVFTRWCDWLVREFVVLYVLVDRGVSARDFGLLVGLQNLTALVTYLPVGRLTARVSMQPFIGLTFIFFALFPLTLALCPQGTWWLIVPFIVYGLREIGEPARKATITSLFPETVRARGVGLYWGIRSFALCWASLVAAVIWQLCGPEVLLYFAFGMGCVGAGVYYLVTWRRMGVQA